jgi:hypothetical protein
MIQVTSMSENKNEIEEYEKKKRIRINTDTIIGEKTRKNKIK